MCNYSVLFNPYSSAGKGEKLAREIENKLNGHNLKYFNMDLIKDFKEFFKHNKEDIIICGGDGTLNHFINKTGEIKYKNKVFYYSTGSGNDFHNDIGNKNEFPYNITDYLKKLPYVIINKAKYFFINNAGYGLDGYCCQEADKQRLNNPKKKTNYTSIALKGLAVGFKPRNAKVEVDGKKYSFKNVWMAPSMNGRFYGGGMMIAPDQDRLNKNKKLTLIVIKCKSRVKLLVNFSKIFKGTHYNEKKVVKVLRGNKITVEFDKPAPMQLDGETILDVKKYVAYKK